MEALMSKFPCKNQSKDSLQPSCLSFRKSTESSRSLNRDAVDTSEAHRKAAAWAWHQRGGGEVIPTRPRAFQSSAAAVSRHSIVDRPISLLKVEATRDVGAQASSSNSTSGSGTSLFDASDLSSLAQQIAGFAQRLQEESSSEDSRARIEADKLNKRALDPPWTSDQQASEKEFARHRRSSPDPLRPRQFLHETGGVLGTERNGVDSERDSESRVETGCLPRTGLANIQGTKKLSLKKSFFLIQKFCLKISPVHDDSYSDLSRRIQNHHHYHHHHHYYHYQTPDEELQIIERAKGRRHLESRTPFKERESADDETQSDAADIAGAYWASVGDRIAAARGGKPEDRDYDQNFPRDESLQSTAGISKDRAPRRQSENFDNWRDKARGSAHLETRRMRRYSADIGPSYRPQAGNGREIVGGEIGAVEWE